MRAARAGCGNGCGGRARRAVGALRIGPAMRRLRDAPPNDIFLVKATYYLNL